MIELVDVWNDSHGRRAVSVVAIDPANALNESQIAWLSGLVATPSLPTNQPHVYRNLAVRHGRRNVDRWLRFYEARINQMTPPETMIWLHIGWVGVADRAKELPLPLAAHRRSPRSTVYGTNYTTMDDCYTYEADSRRGLPSSTPCMPPTTELHEMPILDALYARAVQEFMVLR